MASEDVQTNLRLPADLKDRLVASAAENNRSLSAEVASRLEGSYDLPVGYVTKEQFEFALRNAVLNMEADQFVMGTVRTLLANNVVKLFELLSPEQRTEALSNAYEFAIALKSPQGAGLEEAVARIMGRTPDEDAARSLASALRRQEERLSKQIKANRVADVPLNERSPQPKP